MSGSCPPADPCLSWERPSEWPVFPASDPEEQKIVGLVAVENTDMEYLALLCEGDYTVDWGDGTEPEDVTGGVKAEHSYDYASLETSLLSYGYKTVLVVVTPQSGHDLTLVDFQKRHTLVGSQVSYLAKWLELRLNIAACTALTLGSSASEFSVTPPLRPVTLLGRLQSLSLRADSLSSLASLCSYCFGLEHIVLTNTESVTNIYGMFYSCGKLRSAPLFTTSSVANSEFVFGYCGSLACIPDYDLSQATSIEGMFHDCCALVEAPELTLAVVTNAASVFYRCYALRAVPLFNLSSATDINHIFYGCTSLREVPLFDFSSAGIMSAAFEKCRSLRTVPAFNTDSCYRIDRCFYDCLSLTVLPALNLANISSSGYMVDITTRTPSLNRSHMSGARYYQYYKDCPLSAAAINEIFTNLGTAAGTQTITITNCPGAATCDRSIATAKGWTVVG